ncbi:hypothetical protein Tco_1581762, partial [Tanacetum coccineum]
QAGDEQVVVPVSTTQKEKPYLLQSTSSHFVSSNFGNHLINSTNASLIDTIPENAKAEINSLLDVQIQQDLRAIFGSSLPDALKKALQSHTKELKKERSEKRDYKGIIEEFVQANVINEVKNFLPKFLLQAVKEALEKTPPSLGQSSSQGQFAIQAAESLFEYRGDAQDEDPSAGSNQGSGYQQKDRKPSQNDKTEHGMEKTVQNQGQSPKMPKSESILKNQQSNRSRN